MKTSILDPHRSAYFDDLSETWDSLAGPPPEAAIRGFLDRLGIEPGHTVMDLGTGTGLLIPFVFARGPAEVIAADLSARMLAKVEAKYAGLFGGRLRLLHTDVHNLAAADRSVDVVICNGAFPHFYDKALALAQIFRVLRPGGILAVNHFIGREAVNAIHAESANAHIREDLLEPVNSLALRIGEAGFLVREAVDNEMEYCLIAEKPS